jgi:hypothetical protein
MAKGVRMAAALLAVCLAAIAVPGTAEDRALPVAIGGYDPVSYFTTPDGPRRGDPGISAAHDGWRYHFASAAHRALFEANPGGYAPAFRGFCAYGVRMGQTFEADPRAFRIVDGRLFLLLDPGIRFVWMMDEAENVAIADAIWPEIVMEGSISPE